MAWFMVISKPLKPREQGLANLGNEHLDWMREQYGAGRFVFSGPTKEGPGIWVLNVGSKEEASALANTHPWVREGFREVSEIYEWTVGQAFGVGGFSMDRPGEHVSAANKTKKSADLP